ncbi:unnamed protein product, partial [marine sediment metagenome]
MGKYDVQPRQVSEFVWEVPQFGKMNVPVRLYADSRLLEQALSEKVLEQAINVAFLPGIVRASYAMPDAHWGYGFPIGGVAAFDPENGGVLSPGGIGFDINCGVRLIRTDLEAESIRPRLQQLIDALYNEVPCGVGSSKAIRKLSRTDMEEVMREGARWAVRNGYGREEDLVRTEAGGALKGADPGQISQKAFQRGAPQMGTLGSGNHFLEIDEVNEIFDRRVAEAFGVAEGTVALQIH